MLVSKEKYTAAIQERDQLQETVGMLTQQIESMQDLDPEKVEQLETDLQETVNNLNAANEVIEQHTTQLAELNSQIETLTGSNTELTQNNELLNNQVNEIQQLTDTVQDPSVINAETLTQKVQAIIAIAMANPAVIGNVTKEDPDKASADGVDWSTIDKLPHNKQ